MIPFFYRVPIDKTLRQARCDNLVEEKLKILR